MHKAYTLIWSTSSYEETDGETHEIVNETFIYSPKPSVSPFNINNSKAMCAYAIIEALL